MKIWFDGSVDEVIENVGRRRRERYRISSIGRNLTPRSGTRRVASTRKGLALAPGNITGIVHDIV